jgi:hypothetical protein
VHSVPTGRCGGREGSEQVLVLGSNLIAPPEKLTGGMELEEAFIVDAEGM